MVQVFEKRMFANEDCEKGLHTLPSSKKKGAPKNPPCIYCGEIVVDWQRTRRRDREDVSYVVSQLMKIKERYKAWNSDVDKRARNHALRKGRAEFEEFYVQKILSRQVGKVYDLGGSIKQPYRDGFQTPFSGNIVYYAQHATACCCRPCIERWHGIPQGRDLYEEELDYLVSLIMKYMNTKLPELTDNGVYVPPIARNSQDSKSERAPSIEQLALDM